jgi:SAM-dependent methyltransferase
MLDYEKQARFLRAQRWWVAPCAAACALIIAESWLVIRPGIGTHIAATVLACGLFWIAWDLPAYLGMDADAQRRLRWVAKMRWWLLAGMMVAAASYRSWIALGAAVGAAILHLVLTPILKKPVPQDLAAAPPIRLTILAVVYAAADYAVLWTADRNGVRGIIAAELWLMSVFFLLVLIRPRMKEAQLGVAVLGATPAFALSVHWPTLIASLIWLLGIAHLIGRAAKQNRENYEALVASLGEFSKEPREATVQVMAEAGRWLAEDWVRTAPVGQDDVNAWYTRVARRYLYHNCQHHLLYRHITYTLGLLKLASPATKSNPAARVLDFGGGNGNFSRALARRGFDVTYLDVPGEAADYVKWRAEKEGLRVRVCHDLREVEPPFDVIFSLDVVEHLVDMRPVGDAWRAMLKPRGLLVATYYTGPCKTAPMHIDPGYDAKKYLEGLGFRDIRNKLVGPLSAELLRKPNFMILDLPA